MKTRRHPLSRLLLACSLGLAFAYGQGTADRPLSGVPSVSAAPCSDRVAVLLAGYGTGSDDVPGTFADVKTYVLNALGYAQVQKFSYDYPLPYYNNADTFNALPNRAVTALHLEISDILSACANAQIDLIGHSLGGSIALQYLLQYQNLPEARQIQHIVTLDSPVNGSSRATLTFVSNALNLPSDFATSQTATFLANLATSPNTVPLNQALTTRVQGTTLIRTLENTDDLFVVSADAEIQDVAVPMSLGRDLSACIPVVGDASKCFGHAQVLHDPRSLQMILQALATSPGHGWSASLTADKITAPVGSFVTLSAQTNKPLDGSGNVIQILDQTHNFSLKTCSTGTACSTTVVSSSPAIDSYVAVVKSGGNSLAQSSSLAVRWFVPPPAITSVSPSTGPTTGATSVTITGSNFIGATSVVFGSTPATSFTVNSSTQITAVSPAASSGGVDVTVNTAGGTSALSNTDRFTFTGIGASNSWTCSVGDSALGCSSSSLAPLPTGRQYGGVATGGDGKLYEIGGQRSGSGVDVLEVYDPNTNTWACSSNDTSAGCGSQSLAPAPEGMQQDSVVAGKNGLIYAIASGAESCAVGCVGNFMSYDPQSNSWTCASAHLRCASAGLAQMPINSYESSATLGADGRLYVIGGFDSNTQSEVTALQIYDPSTNTWSTSQSPVPTARNYMGIATGTNGLIYTFGGCTNLCNFGTYSLNVVEAYNPSTNTWTCSVGDTSPGCSSATLAPLPTAGQAFSVTTLPNGHMYRFGGINVHSVEAYDPSANAWSCSVGEVSSVCTSTTLTPMPTATPAMPATVAPNGQVFVIGAGPTGQAVEAYTP